MLTLLWTVALAATPTDPDAALGDQWLVIVSSKRDPAEVQPAMAAIAAHPELGLSPRTLASGHFKNLMPCYTVAVAQATPDKKVALGVVTKLKAAGIDAYAKNAGAHVGASAAIDAWCARKDDEDAVEGARLAVVVDGKLWLPSSAPSEQRDRVVQAAPPPVSLDAGYATWLSPAPAPPTVGRRVRVVEVDTGRSQVCAVSGGGVLTLGIPHFGLFQQPGTPKAPVCGSPALYDALTCPEATGSGPWVAVAEGAALDGYRREDASKELVAAATAALERDTDYEEPGEDVSRSVDVGVWRGPKGPFVVVAGTRTEGPGVCGGDESVWIRVFALDGAALGAPKGDWTTTAFATVRGLVDVGGDGVPELVLHTFPSVLSLDDIEGVPLDEHTTDYCDCPC
ncbi:MAG: hypothetical protein H6738_03335 [Alphaproteobacteria bacterium]|nr:hypothetical protein [Alphaproteobacteria bacterium]MCB9695800.1 hypothetical protein [Alphaproteobacteria bacterium]